MQAYEIEVTIPEDHKLVLPPQVPAGRARMIVLMEQESVSEPTDTYSAWSKFITQLEASHARRELPAADEIDRRIADVRADWD